jgi:hypothetical protein
MNNQQFRLGCALVVFGWLCVAGGGCKVRTVDEVRTVVDLNGKWKFEIGDDSLRSRPSTDDASWDNIKVPSAWEDAGFPGYDGYAWYRKHFTITAEQASKTLFLGTGPIDDVDETYINGYKIGSTGSFPPHFETAFNVDRRYRVAARYLNPGGDNVVAVRVYDDGGAGGFLWGDVRLIETRYALQPDVPIPDDWRICFGDDKAWKDPSCDDSGWEKISVPGCWESQEHADYDGYAWYRTRFTVPKDLAGEKLVLLAGKIDDFDETYLNGVLVGRTGVMDPAPESVSGHDEYTQLRAYYLNPDALKFGGENVVAIRVYDGFRDGGICEGPVGLFKGADFQHWRKRSGNRDWF